MKSLTKVIAGTTGLAAFGIATVAGLAAGNDATEVLLRALVAMAACHLLGLAVGGIAERTLDEYVKAYYAASSSTPDAGAQTPGDKSRSSVDKPVLGGGAG